MSPLETLQPAPPGPQTEDQAAPPHDLRALPKAHLHLHLTGAMRHPTLVALAARHGISLPPALTQEWPPQLSTMDERGWFRFQRLYDMARSVLRTPEDLYRLVREIAEDERAEGSRWLELQADPSGFAARYGGITAFTEMLLDAAENAAPAGRGLRAGLQGRRAGRAAARPARRRACRRGQRQGQPGPAAREPARARRPVGGGPAAPRGAPPR